MSSGFLLLLLFPLGVALIVLAAIGVLRSAPRLAGTSGLLVGVGTIVLVLMIRAQLECEAFNSVPNQGCESPDIKGYLAVGGGLLMAGLVGSLEVLRRGPPGRG